MAAAALSEEELRELCVELVAALTDLIEIDSTPIEYPLPDDIRERLRQRDALAETLKTLPPEERKRLAEVYRLKYADAGGWESDIELPPTIDEERSAYVDDLVTRMRRRAIYDDGLRAAVLRCHDLPWITPLSGVLRSWHPSR